MNQTFWGAQYLALNGKVAEAVEIWKVLAEKGDVLSLHELGSCYATGNGVDKDLKRAIDSWQKAAQNGHPCSWVQLGTAHLKGDLQPAGEDECLKCYIRAAHLGHPDARLIAAAQLLAKGNAEDTEVAHLFLQLLLSSGGDPEPPPEMSGPLMATYLIRHFMRPDTARAIARFHGEFGTMAVPFGIHEGVRKRLLSFEPDFALVEKLDPLPQRSARLLFAVHDELLTAIQTQNLFGFAGQDGSTSPLTPLDVFKRHQAAIAGKPANVFALSRDDFDTGIEGSHQLKKDEIWKVVKPMDRVLLTDGAFPHYSEVFRIDRQKGKVWLIDPWPEKFRYLAHEYRLLPVEICGANYEKKLIEMESFEFSDLLRMVITLRDSPSTK